MQRRAMCVGGQGPDSRRVFDIAWDASRCEKNVLIRNAGQGHLALSWDERGPSHRGPGWRWALVGGVWEWLCDSVALVLGVMCAWGLGLSVPV